MDTQIDLSNYDVIIVGAGLSGCVIAERFANLKNKKVLIIEKRDHIGGNCYDYVDENGIIVSKYGAHLFHTNDTEVWNYINQFDIWKRWEHKVVGLVDNTIVPIPVNITTVNMLCGESIQNENEMDVWLKNVQVKYDVIENSEQIAKSRVGETLYDKIFKEYTYKQWNKYPSELKPEILARIPVRNNFDDRYFTDKYQALPHKGYTHFFQRLLDNKNITVVLNVDFLGIINNDNESNILNLNKKIIIYTGPIDSYFSDSRQSGSENVLEKLEYRSIDFVVERYKNMNFYQTNSVVNYPSSNVDFTRIVEYKHFLNQSSPHTTIVKEFTNDSGEPFYPVLNDKNLKLYEKYKEMAINETKKKNVHFIGRLANYKYFNMDQAIKNSLTYFDNYFDHYFDNISDNNSDNNSENDFNKD
jgi:UDP-galactopyranose mutase